MLPSLERIMQITILDDSKGEKCAAGCGPDWSSAEAVALASQQIKDRFGEGIRLEYLDLSKPDSAPNALQLLKKIGGENLLLPVLAVDGVARISGQFDIRQLLDVIETEIQINR